MCCIFLSISHPVYQLILISNRDEFLRRSTCPSHWHNFPSPSQILTSQPPSSSSTDVRTRSSSHSFPPAANEKESSILSGIDAEGGGTWLGITKNAAFGALTNFTEIQPPPLPANRGIDKYRSRGVLVKDWLSNSSHQASARKTESPEEYLSSIAKHSDEYPGFNLLVGQLASSVQDDIKLGYLSNREEPSAQANEGVYEPKSDKDDRSLQKDHTLPSAKRIDLAHGGRVYCCPSEFSTAIHDEKLGSGCESCGLSNSTLDERWEKVNKGKVAFEKVIAKAVEAKAGEMEEEEMIEDLFKLLGTSATDHITSREDVKSSILIPPLKINQNWYATRTATVLIVERPKVDQKGVKAKWIERDVFILNQDEEPIRSRNEGKNDQRRWEWEFGAE